jgi:hypothetical protein
MKTFKKYWSVAAYLLLLGVVWGLFETGPSKTEASAAGPVVTVGNIPLPIAPTGTQAVSGTVAATQSGTWNVGITGTPSVSISGTPSVSGSVGILGTPSVNVLTMPLVGIDPSNNLVRLVGEFAPEPFAAEVVCTITSTTNCEDITTVAPSGKQLAIEYVSAHLVPSPMVNLVATVSTQALWPAPTRFRFMFGGVPQYVGTTVVSYDVSSQTVMRAPGGSTVGFGCISDEPITVTCDVTVSGHLVPSL